jgi:hypothetical protein
MFSLLRAILIIGVIFYYSPVRQGGAPASLDGLTGWTKPADPTEAGAGRLEAAWDVLPERAKQAVVDKMLASTGLGAQMATDTLLPTDRQLAPSKGQ